MGEGRRSSRAQRFIDEFKTEALALYSPSVGTFYEVKEAWLDQVNGSSNEVKVHLRIENRASMVEDIIPVGPELFDPEQEDEFLICETARTMMISEDEARTRLQRAGLIDKRPV